MASLNSRFENIVEGHGYNVKLGNRFVNKIEIKLKSNDIMVKKIWKIRIKESYRKRGWK